MVSNHKSISHVLHTIPHTQTHAFVYIYIISNFSTHITFRAHTESRIYYTLFSVQIEQLFAGHTFPLFSFTENKEKCYKRLECKNELVCLHKNSMYSACQRIALLCMEGDPEEPLTVRETGPLGACSNCEPVL